jgi:hypothetical protein
MTLIEEKYLRRFLENYLAIKHFYLTLVPNEQEARMVTVAYILDGYLRTIESNTDIN